jgi:hypothetical protein
LVFDGKEYRTTCVNEAASLIIGITKELEGQKNGTNHEFSDLSLWVIPLGQNSNSFLEDLRRLNQLKDSPYQSDIFVKKVNQPKLLKTPTKERKLKR